MKIRVVRHFKADDFAKTGEVFSLDVYLAKNLIAEFDEYPEQKYEGFLLALKYIHGKGLGVVEESLNDYYERAKY